MYIVYNFFEFKKNVFDNFEIETVNIEFSLKNGFILILTLSTILFVVGYSFYF